MASKFYTGSSHFVFRLLSHSEDDGTSSGHTLGAAQSTGAEDTTPAASNPPQQPLSLKCDE